MPYKETDLYLIEIGMSELQDSKAATTCYKVRNKETGIVEAETTILPYAIGWMEEFTELLSNNSNEKLPDITMQ